MGVGNRASLIYIIDFGLSKQFRSPDTHLHIPYRRGLGLTGTPLFASNNSHAGCELGRRDDLESLAYILAYLARGSLPWEGLADPALVAQRKLDCSAEELCSGLPNEFAAFLSYARSLPFEDKPEYAYLSGLFDRLRRREGFQDDAPFDWEAPRHVSHTTSLSTIKITRTQKQPITPARRTG